jgi:uncharacterized membrane protein
MKKGYGFLIFLLLFSWVQYSYYYSLLPDPVASNFDGRGHPNGWMSKPFFFMAYFGMLALFTFIFALFPRILDRIPVSLISMPNRDYWFNPERRAETVAFISRQMLWYGNATLLFMIFLFELVLRANLKPGKNLSSSAIWILLSVYGTFTVVWVIHVISRFRKNSKNGFYQSSVVFKKSDKE